MRTRCLLVTSVSDDSGAAQIGLQVGDYILSIGGNDIQSHAHLSKAMAELTQPETMTINRRGQIIFLSIKPGRLGMVAEEDVLDPAAYAEENLDQSLYRLIPVVTMDVIEGRPVEQVLGVVTAEVVEGTNALKEIFVDGRDLFGGRSKTVQDGLKAAKETCLHEIRREAYSIGANAILGLRLHYSQISGKGTTMLLVVASGTAVILPKR